MKAKKQYQINMKYYDKNQAEVTTEKVKKNQTLCLLSFHKLGLKNIYCNALESQ